MNQIGLPLLTQISQSGVHPYDPRYANIPGWKAFDRKFMENLENAAYVNAGAAIKSLLISKGDGVFETKIGNAPLAPPFPIYWMEYSVERTQFGGLFVATEKRADDGARTWHVMVLGVRGEPDRPPFHSGGVSYDIATDGQIVGEVVVQFPYLHQEAKLVEETLSGMVPMLSAHRFFACKNIRLEEREFDAKTSKLFRRRSPGPPKAYKYHVLLIQGSSGKSHGKRGSKGEPWQALHVCRGHFATYTAEKPLFGRPSGVGEFWHPAHIRGDISRGVVDKDYKI